jgi:uncharacterized surface protein with fasciclin (FAS1) repeats
MRLDLSQAAKRCISVNAGTMLAIVSLAAAACGATASSGSATTRQPVSGSSSAPASTSARVGTHCGMFPSAGMSGMHSLRTDKALTAAARNPQLSLLTAAAAKAGLTADLNSMHPLTIVAPSNSAFTHVSMMTVGMLRNKTDLKRILRYHVVAAPISPAQMAHGVRASTLEGSALTFSKKGSVYEVNGAAVLCGNIQTANATIYIIDKVLTPPK